MKTARLLVAAFLIGLLGTLRVESAFSHPGATNADGCHTNHKTGEYHCHGPKRETPGRVNYCHVINGESRCGYALSTCSDLVSRFGGSCRQQ